MRLLLWVILNRQLIQDYFWAFTKKVIKLARYLKTLIPDWVVWPIPNAHNYVRFILSLNTISLGYAKFKTTIAEVLALTRGFNFNQVTNYFVLWKPVFTRRSYLGISAVKKKYRH